MRGWIFFVLGLFCAEGAVAARYGHFAELLVLRGERETFSELDPPLFRRGVRIFLPSTTGPFVVNLFQTVPVELSRNAALYRSRRARAETLHGESLNKILPQWRDWIPPVTGLETLGILMGGPAGLAHAVGRLTCKKMVVAAVRSENNEATEDEAGAQILADAIWAARAKYAGTGAVTVYALTITGIGPAERRLRSLFDPAN